MAISSQQTMMHSTESATLADILERVLDKGIVIAGDIKIKLVDIELLTIQIRLVVCSVDRAMEMGMDWWTTDRNLSSGAQRSQGGLEAGGQKATPELDELGDRLTRLEATMLEPAEESERRI